MMKPLTIVASYNPAPFFEDTLFSLARLDLVERVVIISQKPIHLKIPKCRVLVSGPLPSHETLGRILSEIGTQYLLFLLEGRRSRIEPEALRRIVSVAESTKAGLVYSNFYDEGNYGKILHSLCDYQLGSVRDDFDFGAIILFSVAAVRGALKKYGGTPSVQFAGLYDLRLKVSIGHPIHHVPEPSYSMIRTEGRDGEAMDETSLQKKMFAYLDRRHETAQKEMEAVFTDYLKKIKAYLPPDRLAEVEQRQDPFPLEASVIIPVRNRRETIAEAVKSALSQETDFPFNVIVVDNHSTDGTTAVLSNLSRQYFRLNHVVPERTDLGIGGCWNEAIQHEACGRYAVQLDSDDLYSGNDTLQRMVDMLRRSRYAMVIGSYTLVDSRLREIPPGLIGHREWSDENGHNNALRINGLGAPRAFNTRLMRRIKFANVSYGEDYAAALRICREYRIGRIYESLYLCRRWPGNTDAILSIEEENRNNAFKDKVRTDEILARQKIVEGMAREA